jgi:hypothetical protein
MPYGKDWSDKVKAAHDLHYAREEERALFQQVKTLGTLAQQEKLPDLYLEYGFACLRSEDALKDFRKAKF